MENNIDFENFDKFDRQPFAKRLTKAISTFSPFSDEAYVLTLNASYGSGKTTFLTMWKAHLEDEGYKVVYLNAWENDFDDEPIIPIATGLIDQIKDTGGSEEAGKALQRVVGITALAANGILNKYTGINAEEIESRVEEGISTSDLQKLGRQLSKVHSLKKEIYEVLRAELSEYLKGIEEKPLIVLVDELDRVQPDYAVRFLEAIKHIFPIPGMCFVLAIDKNQLEASVKRLFGEIDFPNYFRRFVTREASLPHAYDVEWKKFIKQVAQDYFDRKEMADIPILLKDEQKEMIQEAAVELCPALNLTPRQAEHMFRVFVQFIAVESDNKIYNNWLRMSLFLVALMVSNYSSYYHKLGRDELPPKEIADLFDKLSFQEQGREKKHHYLFGCVLAFSLTEDNEVYQNEAVSLFKNFVMVGDDRDVLRELSRALSEGYSVGTFPYKKSTFQSLYKKIEEWRDFIS